MVIHLFSCILYAFDICLHTNAFHFLNFLKRVTKKLSIENVGIPKDSNKANVIRLINPLSDDGPA